MTNAISLTQIPSFRSVGWTPSEGMKLATRQHILCSLLVCVTALADRTVVIYNDLMSRLAMMEMRMMLAYVYEDIFIATRGPLELRIRPVHTKN
jgi:hypothetical protein